MTNPFKIADQYPPESVVQQSRTVVLQDRSLTKIMAEIENAEVTALNLFFGATPEDNSIVMAVKVPVTGDTFERLMLWNKRTKSWHNRGGRVVYSQ